MTLLNVLALVAVLYFAKDVFLPIVMAILFSFLFAPIISRLERIGCGRIFSVMLVTLLATAAIGGTAYLVGVQVMDLAEQLPSYQSNIEAKLSALESSPDSRMAKVRDSIEHISEKLEETQNPQVPLRAARPSVAQGTVPVRIVDDGTGMVSVLSGIATPLLGPLGMGAIVMVFVIFMLIEREDLRDRCIHLFGVQRLHVTTKAIDDAGHRVSRYLLAQLTVNVSYGIPIGIGLYFIGIPNALLWGFLSTVLRFVPYVGPWIAAFFPLTLSLAVAPGWAIPLMTIGLFVVMEVISNNVVEPWLYGSSTGLSPVAIIVSAVFWAWLWGPAGLLLATPLTVCLAVMGKYIPSLAFLDVLLGSRPPIADSDRLYQRLLTANEVEALDVLEDSLEERTLADTFETVLLPAIRCLDENASSGLIDEGQARSICAMLRELVDDVAPPVAQPETGPLIVLIPAAHESDEIAALLLARLMRERECRVDLISSRLMMSETVTRVIESDPNQIFVSVVGSGSVLPATHLVKRIREGLPGVPIQVCLWCDDEVGRSRERLERAEARIFTSLESASATLFQVLPLRDSAAS